MLEARSDSSPTVHARTAGLLFLVLLVAAVFSVMYVPTRVVVPGDAAATAAGLAARAGLFRAGMLGDAVIFLTELAMTVVLYRLFEPVSRTIAQIAAAARLAMAVVQATNLVVAASALLVTSRPAYLAAFGQDRADGLVLLAFDAHGVGVKVWQAFFGLHCLALGVLVRRARFLPTSLGSLMLVAAIGYLTDSVAALLSPSSAERFAWVVAITSLIGEFPLFLWLLIRGVDVERRPVVPLAS